MAKFCSLFSSSSGNCTYIGTEKSGILIDIGVSAKKTETALRDIGVDPASIGAVFVTHEHSDHIGGIKVFASKYGVNVYASRGTLEGMDDAGVFNGKFNAYEMPKNGYEVGGIFVKPFKTPHDSRESTGYGVQTPDGKKISVATDMGMILPRVIDALSGSDLILLESNHDVGMLRNGPYPYFLKERILSDRGHLSNEVCADAAVCLLKSGTTRFVLGHLSRENNFPSLAYETTHSAMTMAGAKENSDYSLCVAGDNNPPIIL